MQMVLRGRPGNIKIGGNAPINSATPDAGGFYHPVNKGFRLRASAVAPADVETSTFAKAAADEMAGRKASASAKATADRMADKLGFGLKFGRRGSTCPARADSHFVHSVNSVKAFAFFV